MATRLTFLGGVGTVTGSKYLIESAGNRLLVDCGLFQGYKQLRLRNWSAPPFNPATIDAVVLTHAHIDHSGYLPLLVRKGFSGPVVCSSGTRDLCKILLPDSGFLQEKDAELANRYRFSKHKPAYPLYTRADAIEALQTFTAIPFGQDHEIAQDVCVRLDPAGHILGASIVTLKIEGKTVVFSGDLGRPNSATMLDPAAIRQADYLIVESTYGNRRHERTSPEDALAEIIVRTAARGGTVLIPSFAVGRTQTLLYYLKNLKKKHRIPDIPVFLDSPMAINASDTFCEHAASHRLSEEECRSTFSVASYTRSVDELKALAANPMPKIIISASGMATGGRVLHHLKHYAPDHRNTILFAGFQAGGTRGDAITNGAKSVKIHGAYVSINAEVGNLDMLSAHADAEEILSWLGNFRAPPKTTFITHGEPDASDALRRKIEGRLKWQCVVPDYKDAVDLT